MDNTSEQVYVLNSNDTPSISLQSLSHLTVSTQAINLENVENFSNVCRICATVTEFIIPIFQGEGLQNNLAVKIKKHLPIQVAENDSMPHVVCYQCASTVLAWHELVQCCIQADEAIRTKLATSSDKKQESVPNIKADPVLTEEQEVKFKKDAKKFVESPQYIKNSVSSNTTEKLHPCSYCDMRYTARNYKNHLITHHSELLFHCDECYNYVDKREFLSHMSIHAIIYTSNQSLKTECDRDEERKNDIKEENNETNDIAENITNLIQNTGSMIETNGEDTETASRNKIVEEITEEKGGEFSDHSDSEYGFGPLPESVFEAIEDTQESQVDESTSVLPYTSEIFTKTISNTPIIKSNDQSDITSSLDRKSIPKQKRVKSNKSRTCPICAKVCNAHSSYFYHMKYFHRGCKEHECNVCGKKFATRASLAEHSSIHTGICELECRQCGKKFRSKASLYIHEQSHNGVKSWACTQCHRSFRWRTQLVRHQKRHSALKSHVCGICGRGFNIHCDLLRHARTHTAGNFTCDKCNAKFAQLRYLKTHVLKKHSAAFIGKKN